MYIDYLKTPLGIIEIQASEQGICQVIFSGNETHRIHSSQLTDRCKQQLKAYFVGERTFFDLPLTPKGTPFQQAIWKALQDIPFGHTQSYQNLADKINNPKAVRAVGGANGRNPISIILPCHRVIGRNGTLTGYAGGIERKYWLLEHEGILIQDKALAEVQDLQQVIQTRQAKTQFLK